LDPCGWEQRRLTLKEGLFAKNRQTACFVTWSSFDIQLLRLAIGVLPPHILSPTVSPIDNLKLQLLSGFGTWSCGGWHHHGDKKSFQPPGASAVVKNNKMAPDLQEILWSQRNDIFIATKGKLVRKVNEKTTVGSSWFYLICNRNKTQNKFLVKFFFTTFTTLFTPFMKINTWLLFGYPLNSSLKFWTC
jgi:hypothetical protein